MTRYVLRRLLGAVPLVLGIASIIFFVVNLAPGDPTTYLMAPGMSAEVVEQLRVNYGLDEPVHVRYVKWVGSMLTGDFGYSFTYRQPVVDVLWSFLPNTLILSACALVLAFLVGIVLGTLQAVKQYSGLDSTLSVVLLFFYSMPSFWLALMLILTMSLMARNVWGWPIYFPASGMMS
ncbi:MAG TPA: ABC transporter permease, partial [Acidimicrobiia bacterium]|nr:ABC transporter permease [Acidimicrobiia bacterium]